MELRPHAIEYANWTYCGVEDAQGLMEASFDGGRTWHALETPSSGTLRLLLAGPLAEDIPTSAVRMQAGSTEVIVRRTDLPEVLPRDGGSIFVPHSGY